MTFRPGDPCYRLHPTWTRASDDLLLSLIGRSTYREMAHQLGKSVDAVRKRAKRLGYRLDQGAVTLRELARTTGYDRHQLRRAKRALGQAWMRAAGRKLLIRGEQVDELLDYLTRESAI